MATTTNYNWATPDDTDLVKDGAAAIRTLGSSADTTVKNLNPGTTAGDIDYYTSGTAKARIGIGTAGQVLKVNAGATAPEWATTADQTPLTTKGDLFTFDTADARLGVGANGTVLTADSAETTGLKWAAPAGGGGMTLLTTTTLSGTSTTSATFATTYKELVCHFYGLDTSVTNEIRLRVNSNTGNNYGMAYLGDANTSLTQDNGTSGVRVVDYFATVPGYAVGKIVIPEYANTNLTTKSCFVFQTNTSARRMISVGYITETTAISSLTFYSTSTISGTVLIYGAN